MTARKWWPAEWADEVMPPGRDAPDGFLIDAGGHYWLGYALDAKDATEQDKRYFSRGLDAGDIINFICCDDLGDVTLHIEADGSYRVDGAVPERATHFCEHGNVDSLAHSIDDFVFQYRREWGGRRTVEVAMAWWSDALPHKLVVTYDGDRRSRAAFVAVSAAEARQ